MSRGRRPYAVLVVHCDDCGRRLHLMRPAGVLPWHTMPRTDGRADSPYEPLKVDETVCPGSALVPLDPGGGDLHRAAYGGGLPELGKHR